MTHSGGNMNKILVTPHHSLLSNGLHPIMTLRQIAGRAGGAKFKEINYV